MKIGAVGLGNRIAHVYHELSQINKEAELIAYVDPLPIGKEYAEKHNFSIVREDCGHGIGTSFHEDPQVLHYGTPGTGLELQEGMTFTIEPMVNLGKRHTKLLADGWTVITKDRKLSAQWEHTLGVTANGYEVFTLSPSESGLPD